MNSTLCQKWVLKTRFSFLFVCLFVCLSKSSRFHVLWTIRFCSNFTSMWSKYFSNNVWRDFWLPMSAFATVAWKSYNGKFTAKIVFSLGYFTLPLLMLTLEVCSFSIHYLPSIWTTCWWNLNKIVWSELYKIWSFFAKKWLTSFDKVLKSFSKM